ncbi:clock-controlled protein 8 [Planoprotostelium fungivorum]|uniref:Clock-controlled protein 8 n=1 Tax=Planoprotostelium fungivorum TaxID=1890364 RepID=A0A2P6NTY0_9EUKA|nr:clock-controlled protein 8 [Planoprotostelium fungivorum]
MSAAELSNESSTHTAPSGWGELPISARSGFRPINPANDVHCPDYMIMMYQQQHQAPEPRKNFEHPMKRRYMEYLMNEDDPNTHISAFTAPSHPASISGVPFSSAFSIICPRSPPREQSPPPMLVPSTDNLVVPKGRRPSQSPSPVPSGFRASPMMRAVTPDSYRYTTPSPAPTAIPGSPDPTAHPHFNHHLPSIANLVQRGPSPINSLYVHPPQQTPMMMPPAHPVSSYFTDNDFYPFREDFEDVRPMAPTAPAPDARQTLVTQAVYEVSRDNHGSPKGTNPTTIEGKIEEILFLDKLQPRMNRRWGKMLRQSLKSEAQGKVHFTDTIKKKNFFQFNFAGKGEKVPTDDENITKKIFHSLPELEQLFNVGDKPVTTKSYSLEYGRKVIHSALQPPLIITYNSESKTITFEGDYKSYTQEKIHPKRLAKEENERIRNHNMNIVRAAQQERQHMQDGEQQIDFKEFGGQSTGASEEEENTIKKRRLSTEA